MLAFAKNSRDLHLQTTWQAGSQTDRPTDRERQADRKTDRQTVLIVNNANLIGKSYTDRGRKENR